MASKSTRCSVVVLTLAGEGGGSKRHYTCTPFKAAAVVCKGVGERIAGSEVL